MNPSRKEHPCLNSMHSGFSFAAAPNIAPDPGSQCSSSEVHASLHFLRALEPSQWPVPGSADRSRSGPLTHYPPIINPLPERFFHLHLLLPQGLVLAPKLLSLRGWASSSPTPALSRGPQVCVSSSDYYKTTTRELLLKNHSPIVLTLSPCPFLPFTSWLLPPLQKA